MDDILEYKGYYATVHFNAEDEVFHGKIIGINDLVSFEGTTVPELKKGFHEAVEDYIETCKLIGKDPEKAYKGSFNVRIPAELHKEAARYATLKNMSLNELVKQAIANILTNGPNRRLSNQILFYFSILTPALIAGFLMPVR